MKTDHRSHWGPIVLLLMAWCSCPLWGDWKEEVGKYLQKAHQYDRVAAYLEYRLPEIPETEKPAAVVLMSYAYKESGDTVNEEKWISHYFSTHFTGNPADIPQLNFLERKEAIKCFQYMEDWQRKYPRVLTVGVNHGSQKIPYFEPPEKFFMDIETTAPSGLTVTGPNNTLLYTGYLHAGQNAVPLPFSTITAHQGTVNMLFRLKSGSIEITRPVRLRTGYSLPPEVDFDPAAGTMTIKGYEFKQEHSEEIKRTTTKYFDKKRFYKKALPEIGAGVALFAVNRLTAHNKVNSDTLTPNQKALWNGVDKTSAVFAAGISAKGIIDIFKCFKKETRITKTVKPHPEAIRYNEDLRLRLLSMRPLIFRTYAVDESQQP